MKDMTWKRLSTEYLFRRPWLTARRDRVQLPDGRVNDEYYVLEYPTWVNVIAVTEDGMMVIIRQYRHGLGQTNFELVAGVVEDGELPLQAAQRELLEETGYAGGEWEELMVISANASSMNNLSHCFLAKGVKCVSTQHLDACEDIEVYLFSEQEVRRLVDSGEFVQAFMLAPLYKYFSR